MVRRMTRRRDWKLKSAVCGGVSLGVEVLDGGGGCTMLRRVEGLRIGSTAVVRLERERIGGSEAVESR